MDKKLKFGFLGLGAAAVIIFLQADINAHCGEGHTDASGNILMAAVDELPPEPADAEPEKTSEESVKQDIPSENIKAPAVKQEIKELSVPEGKEVILDVYTVKKGDYLRKIARREYGDHELWEVIYGYNKYIKDPHWIFPGDKIILPRIVAKLPEVPEAEPKEKEETAEEVEMREYKDFLAPENFIFDAAITGFKEYKNLYGQGDYAFIDLGQASGIKEKDRLYIYREGRRISHPYTGERLGRVVERIGVVEVTPDIEYNNSTARIIYSDINVQKGDMLLFTE